MLFGHIMATLNDNDDEEEDSDRDGYGAKIANIFSSKFTVETTDGLQKYVQSFHNNMTQIDQPDVCIYEEEEEHTMISFTPDLEKLGMTELTDDTVSCIIE